MGWQRHHQYCSEETNKHRKQRPEQKVAVSPRDKSPTEQCYDLDSARRCAVQQSLLGGISEGLNENAEEI